MRCSVSVPGRILLQPGMEFAISLAAIGPHSRSRRDAAA